MYGRRASNSVSIFPFGSLALAAFVALSLFDNLAAHSCVTPHLHLTSFMLRDSSSYIYVGQVASVL